MPNEIGKSSLICYHGLSDDCDVTSKTTVEDYEHRKVYRNYSYQCKRHGTIGIFTIEAPMADPPK